MEKAENDINPVQRPQYTSTASPPSSRGTALRCIKPFIMRWTNDPPLLPLLPTVLTLSALTTAIPLDPNNHGKPLSLFPCSLLPICSTSSHMAH